LASIQEFFWGPGSPDVLLVWEKRQGFDQGLLIRGMLCWDIKKGQESSELAGMSTAHNKEVMDHPEWQFSQ